MTPEEHREHADLIHKFGCSDITPAQLERLAELDSLARRAAGTGVGLLTEAGRTRHGDNGPISGALCARVKAILPMQTHRMKPSQLFLPIAVELTARRLRLPEDCSQEQFSEALTAVKQCREASIFWLADLIAQGADRWSMPDVADAVMRAGFSPSDVKLAEVLSGLSPEARSEKLSPALHVPIARLDGEARQLEWMHIAEEARGKMTPSRLRDSIRAGALVEEGVQFRSAEGSRRLEFACPESVMARFRLWYRGVEDEIGRAHV